MNTSRQFCPRWMKAIYEVERTVVGALATAPACVLSITARATMGLRAIDGLPMGMRCGSIDPAVVLYLMSSGGLDLERLEAMLYHESGLLSVSGISSDVRTLLASSDVRAAEALGFFVYRIGRELGSLGGGAWRH